jgi:hypothetical protein
MTDWCLLCHTTTTTRTMAYILRDTWQAGSSRGCVQLANRRCWISSPIQ